MKILCKYSNKVIDIKEEIEEIKQFSEKISNLRSVLTVNNIKLQDSTNYGLIELANTANRVGYILQGDIKHFREEIEKRKSF